MTPPVRRQHRQGDVKVFQHAASEQPGKRQRSRRKKDRSSGDGSTKDAIGTPHHADIRNQNLDRAQHQEEHEEYLA